MTTILAVEFDTQPKFMTKAGFNITFATTTTLTFLRGQKDAKPGFF